VRPDAPSSVGIVLICCSVSFFPALRYLHSFPTRRSSDLTDARTLEARASRDATDNDARYRYHYYFTPTHGATAAFQEPSLAELRSEEHTSELQSRFELVCRLLLEKKNPNTHCTEYNEHCR